MARPSGIPDVLRLEKGDKIKPGDFFIDKNGQRQKIPSTWVDRDAGDSENYDAPLVFYRSVKR